MEHLQKNMFFSFCLFHLMTESLKKFIRRMQTVQQSVKLSISWCMQTFNRITLVNVTLFVAKDVFK